MGLTLLVGVSQERIFVASADTAGGEEEPVHEDPGTVIVRVVRQQSVPLVLLLARTVSTAPWSRLPTRIKWRTVRGETKPTCRPPGELPAQTGRC